MLQRLRLEAVHDSEVSMSYMVSSTPVGQRVTLVPNNSRSDHGADLWKVLLEIRHRRPSWAYEKFSTLSPEWWSHECVTKLDMYTGQYILYKNLKSQF